MRIVEFDGTGRPRVEGVVSGQVLLLLQGEKVSVVRLELLPPERYGPEFEHALNEVDLADDALRAIQSAFPAGFSRDRHWVLECPAELAARAEFPGRK
jgi:hypothetical protein